MVVVTTRCRITFQILICYYLLILLLILIKHIQLLNDFGVHVQCHFLINI